MSLEGQQALIFLPKATKSTWKSSDCWTAALWEMALGQTFELFVTRDTLAERVWNGQDLSPDWSPSVAFLSSKQRMEFKYINQRPGVFALKAMSSACSGPEGVNTGCDGLFQWSRLPKDVTAKSTLGDYFAKVERWHLGLSVICALPLPGPHRDS